MREAWKLVLIFTISILPLPGLLDPAGPAERLLPSRNPIVVAEGRFVDNGDGTVTDMKRRIMWQKGDNGEEVTFRNAEQYCKNLKLGGYSDWRLPRADERDNETAFELRMPLRARDNHSQFDLYWSSDPTVLIPFNYRPSLGAGVSRAYYARDRARGFVRAVREVGN